MNSMNNIIPDTFIVFSQAGTTTYADFSLLFYFLGFILVTLILIFIRLGKRRR